MTISWVSNYYNNPEMVERAINAFQRIQARMPDAFEMVLVDDHSAEQPSPGLFANIKNLRVYRVAKDIPWNQSGARNIGVLESRRKYVFLMDIDHILPESEAEEVLATAASLARKEIGIFNRTVVEMNGSRGETVLAPNPNIFLMHRMDFWAAGGYDELFAGSYGCEDKYLQWGCRKLGYKEKASAAKLEVDVRGSTRDLSRDRTRNTALVEYLMSNLQYRGQVRFLCDYDLVYDGG